MRSLYIDSNIWNYLLKNQIDLRAEFPASEYNLLMAGEQELENTAIPENSVIKKELKEFVYSSVEKWGIKTDKYFGFYDDRHPKDEQRIGGFNEGRWASTEELDFMEEMNNKLGETKRKSGLFKNEADIALAARSSNSIVLTLDEKPGPLKSARDRGWCVVFLSDHNDINGSLHEYVNTQC